MLGTGKSTLVKFLVHALEGQFNINPKKDICYAAFTGKACQVLQKKGNNPTSTLHKLLWNYKIKGEKKFEREPIFPLEYKIVIVDECSMIDHELLMELSKHRECHFIFLGDPGQLPPILSGTGQTGYDLLTTSAHIFLDEVMRQAQDSEIIKLSMDIRQGKKLQNFKGKEVQILNKEELIDGMLLWADQIICATNATRVELNNRIRKLKGFGEQPEDGDKVICLKNDWDIFSDKGQPLVNGIIGTLDKSFQSFVYPKKYSRPAEIICGNVKVDTEECYEDLIIDKKNILTGEPAISWQDSGALKQKGVIVSNFTYGYAITAHKSQRK